MSIWISYRRWRTNAPYWEQSAATTSLHNAWMYLYRQYWSYASTQERNSLLPHQKESLDILHQLSYESLERQLLI